MSASPEIAAEGADLVRTVLRLGDTSLILGQRLGELVGHAPALEEDLGLANIALDLIGQARLLLTYAGELEGRGREEDALAFLREPGEYFNLLLAEQPNGDFAQTIVRQWLIDGWQLELYEALESSADARLAGIAAKAVKEVRYHHRFSTGWLERLGDGTPESHARAQRALEGLWRFTGELFAGDAIDGRLMSTGVLPDLAGLRQRWSARVESELAAATLARPPEVPQAWQGRQGRHTEHLGHLLAEMQHLPRSFPGARW